MKNEIYVRWKVFMCGVVNERSLKILVLCLVFMGRENIVDVFEGIIGDWIENV